MITQFTGLVLIIGYFLVVFIITNLIKSRNTKLSYLVAERQIPGWAAAFSFAATWIWAPALFVAAEQAFINGWVGVFWFTVPNIATLVIFSYFAKWMIRKYPDGFTLSGYIKDNYSKRTQNLYLVEGFGLQILSLAVQLLAGGLILHKITGLDYTLVTVLLALIPLLYTVKKGLKASIITDFWQMGWIALVLLLGVPFVLNGAGVDALVSGLKSQAGDIEGLFTGRGLLVTIGFGIPTTIGLLSGTFGDQMFWQRVFSVKKGAVKNSLLWSAVIFGIVPVSLALFGFSAAGAGVNIGDTQLTNVEAVMAFAPNWFLYLFLIMILSGLVSTVDSIICAVSSFTAHDLWEKFKLKKVFFDAKNEDVNFARLSMIAVVILAVAIANMNGIRILHLFLIYGTLRASVMLPTAFSIAGLNVHEKGMFNGILLAMIIGLPVFAYGNFTGQPLIAVTGSLLTILISGVLSLTLKNK